MARGPQFDVGRYWGKVTHQRLGETKSGNPQLVLSFTILGMVNLSDPEGDLLSCPQGERTIYRPLTENTLDYAKQDMDTLGWYGDRWSQFDEENPQFVSIIGNEYPFYCKHKNKQVKNEETGKWVDADPVELREEWSIAQSGGPVVKPLEAKALSKLDAMFGKALKGRQKPQNGTKPTATEQPEKKSPAAMTPQERQEEVPHGDDIPF
jgi:hypothetical protein